VTDFGGRSSADPRSSELAGRALDVRRKKCAGATAGQDLKNPPAMVRLLAPGFP